MAKQKLNVAVIGDDFMGRAHSNAWRQAARFFADAPFEPVLKVLVGRTESRHLVGEPIEVSGLRKTFVSERPLPGSDDGARARVDVDDAAAALVRFESSRRWEKVQAS